jgi:hypothetical protein
VTVAVMLHRDGHEVTVLEPKVFWKRTSVPTTTAYQSSISCRRVVLRLTWWNLGE